MPTIALIVTLLLSACGEWQRPAYAIAYWESGEAFIVGRSYSSPLHTVTVNRRIAALDIDGASSSNEPLRLAIDQSRNRLWVLGTNALRVYELSNDNGVHRARFVAAPLIPAIAKNSSACASDLTLDGNGRVYLSNTSGPTIMVVDPDTNAVTVHQVTATEGSLRSFRGASGIVTVDGGRVLIAAGYKTNLLWRIDTATWQARPIRIVDDGKLAVLHSVCGLRQVPRTGHAWVASILALEQSNSVYLVDFGADYASAKSYGPILAPAPYPINAAVVGESAYFVARKGEIHPRDEMQLQPDSTVVLARLSIPTGRAEPRTVYRHGTNRIFLPLR